MCRRTNCERCGKITWAGCGAHVDAVMAGVPQKDRCRCKSEQRKEPAAGALSNESPIDRVLRVALGAGTLSLAMAGPQSAWGWLGLIPLITGVVGFCPLYRLLGFSTLRRT